MRNRSYRLAFFSCPGTIHPFGVFLVGLVEAQTYYSLEDIVHLQAHHINHMLDPSLDLRTELLQVRWIALHIIVHLCVSSGLFRRLRVDLFIKEQVIQDSALFCNIIFSFPSHVNKRLQGAGQKLIPTCPILHLAAIKIIHV